MNSQEAVLVFQQFIIEHALPLTDMALFGVQCPYCGKADRIRELEHPEVISAKLDPETALTYGRLWQQLSQPDLELGVCKFCQNLLKLQNAGSAEPLYE
jgi:hypothetical protein